MLGTLAGQLSTSDLIGIVAPTNDRESQLYIDGFTSGVKAQKAQVNVDVSFVDSYSDPALAAAAAQTTIDGGANVLTGTAALAAEALNTAGTAESVLWFGNQADQSPLGQGFVVASQMYHWEVLLQPMLTKVDEGVLGGELLMADLANNGVEISYNDSFELDGSLRDAAQATAVSLADGSLQTGVE